MLEPLRPAVQFPFPSALYTREVLSDYLNHFPGDDLVNRLRDRNPFEVVLRALKDGQRAIETALGGGSLLESDTDDWYRTVSSRNILEATRQACQRWSEQWDALFETAPTLSELLPDTKLAELQESVQRLAGFVGKFEVDLGPHFRAVGVLDTSALIARPQVLFELQPTVLVIVSGRAVDELGANTSDEVTDRQAAVAARVLRGCQAKNLLLVEPDLDLLPPGMRTTKSSSTLSVARKYRFCSPAPVLLTEDADLAVEAEALDVQAMTLADFAASALCQNASTSRPGGGETAAAIESPSAGADRETKEEVCGQAVTSRDRR